jgi:Polysaccharide deacetylase
MYSPLLLTRIRLTAASRLLALLMCSSVALVLSACSSTVKTPAQNAAKLKAEPPAEYFIPKDAFTASAVAKKLMPGKPYGTLVSAAIEVPFAHSVVLYASPTTKHYFEIGGLDADQNIVVWESFLRKYKIPFTIATTPGELERSTAGVLLLPSSVALSSREKRVITSFRARGGSVLATWLSGVRDDKGQWAGFDFMANSLDVEVVGDTAKLKDDNFLMPHGDNPVTNSLPAGRRVWLERANQWYPLRLSARNVAAHMMDWSRTFTTDKLTATIAFDDHPLEGNLSSRSVVLGYPERLWQTADPEHLEAIAHNALTWLLRLPSAYKTAWPAPYKSALLLAVDAAEVIAANDMKFAAQLEEIGARATYYLLSDNAAKSVALTKELQSRGHELGFMGDSFTGFRDQSTAVQAARVEKMKARMKEIGVAIDPASGFHAPTESFDKTTESLLLSAGFGHYISFMDATDSRLPFLAMGSSKEASGLATVVFPRTQRGPEDATEEGDVDDGLKSFSGELALAVKMGGLSVIRMPSQSILTFEDLEKVIDSLKEQSKHTWMATASQVASWWRERERVTTWIAGDSTATELHVDVKGEGTVKHPLTVWVNLPALGRRLELISVDEKPVKLLTHSVDQWRTAVVLSDLTPGKYRWKLQFKD